MNRICFEVLGIPVGKGRPRFYRRGKFMGTYTPDKTRNYEENFLSQALKFKPEIPLESDLSVSLIFFFPIPASFSKAKKILANSEMLFVSKKPDIDNLIKSVLDPLNGIFYNDDKQVVKVTAEKRYSMIPRIAVKIEEIKSEK